MQRSSYRIIDANFNRAREALRVMEEYCRFVLNHSGLCGRVKQMRHELSGAVGKLDNGKLLACRDTSGDVGTTLKVDNQLSRGSLEDTFTAAAKRLPEALRVLAETTQTIDATVAAQIEQLRYAGYILEKDIMVFAQPQEKYSRVRLYVVITTDLPAVLFPLTLACIEGGADCIQMRSKNIDDDRRFEMASEFVQLCREGNVLSIINDRVDIAVAADSDGVHLGQNDLPAKEAQKLIQKPMIIGKSTHGFSQLQAACQQPLTYAALGPVFATPTKPTAEAVGMDYVTGGVKMLDAHNLGHVAIGGIDESNIQDILEAGARTVAVCRAVTAAKDPKTACKALKEKIVRFSPDLSTQ